MVLRKISLLAAFAGILAPWTPAHAQEQASLADVARPVRKDKEKNSTPAKRVYTEDDFGPSRRATVSTPGTHRAEAAASSPPAGASSTSGDSDPMAQASMGIDRASVSLDKMEPLDRAALAKVVLEGNDVDFPNRRNWEERLFAAKQAYVARSRQVLGEMQELMTSAQSLQSSQGVASKVTPDTPQAHELIVRAQQLLQEATNTEAALKLVIQEGQEFAKPSSPR
jgi:hypothetical protein